MARFISLIGLNSVDVPGVTVNRFCSSGIETIGMATAKIQAGMANCIIAGGAESMSSVPMTGFKPELNYNTINAGHENYYWGMGNTAEAVANEFNISREDQDEFAFNSHMKALKAQSPFLAHISCRHLQDYLYCFAVQLQHRAVKYFVFHPKDEYQQLYWLNFLMSIGE